MTCLQASAAPNAARSGFDAPAFVHGTAGAEFRLRARLAGFKLHSGWTAEGFEAWILEHHVQAAQTAGLGGSLAPLCYLEARVEK